MREEIEATVADYFRMLSLEMAGQPYNKRAHNRELARLLDGRSASAIEMKHQNISAILQELGCQPIAGYQPLVNYQQSLYDVVVDRIETDRAFDRMALQAVEREAVTPELASLRGILVEAPKLRGVREPRAPSVFVARAVRRDYIEREARNRSLGLAGEQFVAQFEARRLHAGGHKKLADRVEHVSQTRGDGLGYDVVSFEPDGRERYIEVKTTAFGPTVPFFVTRNELDASEHFGEQFILSRVHKFRTEPSLFELRGHLRKQVHLDPVSYEARFS